MFRKPISLLFVFILAACANPPLPAGEGAGVRENSPVPAPNLTVTSQVTVRSTFTSAPESAPAFSYLDALELKTTDELLNANYNGATLPEGANFQSDKSVSPSTPEVSIESAELQSKLAMRAVMRMIMPDAPDNDESLKEFTAKIASGECDDLIRTAELFTTNAEGRQTVKFMPWCGEDYPYPEGVVPIRGVNLVFGKYYEYVNEIARSRLDTPWIYQILSGGAGAGLIIDPESGMISLFTDQGRIVNENSDHRTLIATAFETTLSWLAAEVRGTGETFKLKMNTAQYKRGLLWMNGIEVK